MKFSGRVIRVLTCSSTISMIRVYSQQRCDGLNSPNVNCQVSFISRTHSGKGQVLMIKLRRWECKSDIQCPIIHCMSEHILLLNIIPIHENTIVNTTTKYINLSHARAKNTVITSEGSCYPHIVFSLKQKISLDLVDDIALHVFSLYVRFHVYFRLIKGQGVPRRVRAPPENLKKLWLINQLSNCRIFD